MELGLMLDDEDLGLTRTRTTAQILTSFNAKICKPLWFDSEVTADVTVSENNSQLLKFSGDRHYYLSDYASAAQLYVRSLDVLPNHSQATRLDLQQSLARCYLHLGKLQEADDIAQNLVDTAQNTDQKKQSFILKLEVAMAMRRWKEAESCLHFLIDLQPHFTQFWLQLAQLHHQMAPQGDQKTRLITCYIRAKLLLQSTMTAVSKVIHQRDEALLSQVNSRLEELEVPDEVLQEVSEFLRFDLKQERGCPDIQPCSRPTSDDTDAENDVADSSSVQRPDAFYAYWCGWTKFTYAAATTNT